MTANYSKNMFRQMEELFERVDSLTATVADLKEQVKEKNETIRQLNHKIDRLEATVEKQAKTIKRLEAENAQLRKENAELVVKNAVLEEEISRLKSDRNNNSGNSSNPPSTDQTGGKRANSYNSRKKTGKCQGGQKGHKGTTLTKKTAEELIGSGQCKHTVRICGNPDTGHYTTKYELDIQIGVEVVEYRIYDDAPVSEITNIDSEVFYGAKVKALTAMLYGVGVVSVKRIQEIISGITNGILNISAGAVYSFCRKLSEKAASSLQQIEECILDGTSAYTDATVVTINGKQAYIRNVSNCKAVRYYAMEKKNLDSLKNISLLAQFAGVLIHDHETSMYHFGTGHGECNVHLLRYLLKNTEECGSTWSGKLSELLYEMKTKRDATAPDMPTEEEIDDFINKYDEIIQLGRVENFDTKPKWAKKAEAALLNRLEKYRDNHLLFLKRIDVAFSNNMSERDLRKCKNRQKIAGGFRNLAGCTMYADILSLIETTKRQNLNVFDTILAVFQSSDPVFNFSMG
ncbi:MAG: transposase [Clostridia bacterium]|nr:transposase [Clostridia bacterium]